MYRLGSNCEAGYIVGGKDLQLAARSYARSALLYEYGPAKQVLLRFFNGNEVEKDACVSGCYDVLIDFPDLIEELLLRIPNQFKDLIQKKLEEKPLKLFDRNKESESRLQDSPS